MTYYAGSVPITKWIDIEDVEGQLYVVVGIGASRSNPSFQLRRPLASRHPEHVEHETRNAWLGLARVLRDIAAHIDGAN